MDTSITVLKHGLEFVSKYKPGEPIDSQKMKVEIVTIPLKTIWIGNCLCFHAGTAYIKYNERIHGYVTSTRWKQKDDGFTPLFFPGEAHDVLVGKIKGAVKSFYQH